MEVQRQAWGRPGIYEGVLASGDIQDDLANRYGPSHGWSVSRLNRYGNCPYGFFAHHILGLDALPDPEEGMNPMQRGSLLHALLENLYDHLAEDGVDLTVANQEKILNRLDAVCDKWFPSAPQRYGFRPSALWRYEQDEIRRQLFALILWECEANGDNAPFRPYRQEVRFGLAGGTLPRLMIQVPGGNQFQVHGVIDRVDKDSAGNLRILDYKSGSSRYSKRDIETGLALQSALYALAAARLTGEDGKVLESAYLHIPIRELSGRLKFQTSVSENEQVQAAILRSGSFVSRVRQAIFPAAPPIPARGSRACSEYCELAGLCRVTRLSTIKARRSFP
jgi:ATP-dependent helicase/DNAse subunit B